MEMEAPSDGLAPIVVCCPSAAFQVKPMATVKIKWLNSELSPTNGIIRDKLRGTFRVELVQRKTCEKCRKVKFSSLMVWRPLLVKN